MIKIELESDLVNGLQSIPGSSGSVDIIGYRESIRQFIDWVALYNKNNDTRKSIEKLNNTISSTKQQINLQQYELGLVKFLVGVSSDVEKNLIGILTTNIESELNTLHGNYVKRYISNLIQNYESLGQTNHITQLSQVLDQINTDLGGVILSVEQKTALTSAKNIIEKLMGNIPGLNSDNLVAYDQYQNSIYSQQINEGGVVGLMQDVLQYMDKFKTGNSYDADKIEVEDYMYVHFMRGMLDDMFKHLKHIHDRVSTQYTKDNIFQIDEKILAIMNNIAALDPADITTRNIYEDQIQEYEDLKAILRTLDNISTRLTADAKNPKLSLTTVIQKADSFLSDTRDDILIRIMATELTHPSIANAPTLEDKKAAAKKYIESNLDDLDLLTFGFYANGEGPNLLSQLSRIRLNEAKKPIIDRQLTESLGFKKIAADLESKISTVTGPVAEYMRKHNLTYISSVFYERDNTGQKTGNIMTSYYRDIYDSQKIRIEQEMLDLGETIIQTGNIKDDPDVEDVIIPSNYVNSKGVISQKEHLGRADTSPHEFDRNRVIKDGYYDDILVNVRFPNGKIKSYPLSLYLRRRKAFAFKKINKELQPTDPEYVNNLRLVNERRLQLTPLEFKTWFSSNIYPLSDGTYLFMGELAVPSDEYKNQDFEKLMADPDFKDYYEASIDFYRNAQLKVGAEAVSKWYHAPQIQKDTVEIFGIADNMSAKIFTKNPLKHLTRKMQDIYMSITHLLLPTQEELMTYRQGNITIGPDKVPYRKVNTHFRDDLPVEQLTENLMESFVRYNNMANTVYYGTQEMAKLDGFARLMLDLPWVQGSFLPSYVIKGYKKVGNAFKALKREKLHVDRTELRPVDSGVSVNDKIAPNPTIYGSKPTLVRNTNQMISNYFKSLNTAIDVEFNGAMIGLPQSRWGAYGYNLIQKTMKTVGFNALSLNIVSASASGFAAMLFNFSKSTTSILNKRGPFWLFKSGGAAIDFAKDTGNILQTWVNKLLVFGYNSVSGVVPFIPAINENVPVSKVDYLIRLAANIENSGVERIGQNQTLLKLAKILDFGPWRASGYAIHTQSVITAFRDFRYCAHFKEWLSNDDYNNLYITRIKTPLSNAISEKRRLESISGDPRRIAQLQTEIDELNKIKRFLPRFNSMKSLYDVIQFTPWWKFKNDTQPKISITDVKSKQRKGDGSVEDIDYQEVTTPNVIDIALEKAIQNISQADSKTQYQGQAGFDNNLLFRMFMQIKKWILPNIRNSFKKHYYNEITKKYEVGFYPALIRLIGHYTNSTALLKGMSKDNSKITSEDYDTAYRALTVHAAVTTVMLLLREVLEEKKCKDKKLFEDYSCAFLRLMLLRTKLELATYYISLFGINEVKQLFFGRAPIVTEEFLTNPTLAVGKYAYNKLAGQGNEISNKKYLLPVGKNEFHILGPLNERSWSENEELGIAATPFFKLYPVSSLRNIEIYEQNIKRLNPGSVEQGQKMYDYLFDPKVKHYKPKKEKGNKKEKAPGGASVLGNGI